MPRTQLSRGERPIVHQPISASTKARAKKLKFQWSVDFPYPPDSSPCAGREGPTTLPMLRGTGEGETSYGFIRARKEVWMRRNYVPIPERFSECWIALMQAQLFTDLH